MIVGISAATLEEALEAERNGADYIGVGALFSTSSKQDATSFQKECSKRFVIKFPFQSLRLAVLQQNEFKSLTPNSILRAAVVSAIMKAENPEQASKVLKEVLQSM